MKHVPPLSLRKLKAEMDLKALTLTEVASAAGESHRLPRVSEVLSGRRIDPILLAKLRRVIHAAPQPKEPIAV